MSSDNSLDQRLSFIELSGESRRELQAMAALVNKELPGVLDGFYTKIRATPEVRRFFSSDRRRCRLG